MNPIFGDGDVAIGLGKVTSDGLHIRDAIDGRIITSLPKDERLMVFEVRARQYEWLRVKVIRTGQAGWVAARFVEWECTPDAPRPPPPPPRRWDDPPKPDRRRWMGESLFWIMIVLILGFALALVVSAIRS